MPASKKGEKVKESALEAPEERPMDSGPPPSRKKDKKPDNPHTKSLKRGDPEDRLPMPKAMPKPKGKPVVKTSLKPPSNGEEPKSEVADKSVLG